MEANNKTSTSIAADLNVKNTELTEVKIAVAQMASVGSLPLQDVQKTVNRIEDKVKDMSTTRDEDKQLKEDILKLLREVDGKLGRIDERLKTKEVAAILPEQIVAIEVPSEPTSTP